MSVKRSKKRSRTDWARIDALKGEDIDYSDIPKLGSEFFAEAIRWPGPKKQITIRLDPTFWHSSENTATVIKRRSTLF